MKEQQLYFKELLQSRSLKATKARLALLAIMHDYESAIPFSKIQEKLMEFDRVTVYRMVDSLVEHGVIHKAFREGNVAYYALCGNNCDGGSHNHDHVHFKCNTCETVACEEIENYPTIKLPQHQIQKVTILLEGVCPKCQN